MADLNLYDIKDSEIRIIGQSSAYVPAGTSHQRFRLTWGTFLLLLLGIVLFVVLVWGAGRAIVSSFNRTALTPDEEFSQTMLTDSSADDANAYTIVEERNIGNVALRLLVPTGGRIELTVGRLDSTDASIVLAAQAADYRAEKV